MTGITYKDTLGTLHKVEADDGQTLMEIAIQNNVPGIAAVCGGACACATCHVYIDTSWQKVTGQRSDDEESMLDFALDFRDTSRLSCQIKLSSDMEGMEITIAENDD